MVVLPENRAHPFVFITIIKDTLFSHMTYFTAYVQFMFLK